MFQIRRIYYEFSSAADLGLHEAIPTITFRGAFGYALAQVIAREACIPSLRSQVALYRKFFMPQNDGEYESRNLDLARPFVMRGFYSRPDKQSFILEILLFGAALEYETFFDKVVEVMASMGIGKEKRECHFQKIHSENIELTEPVLTEHLEVLFLTPCVRLKRDGKIYEHEIPFYVLIPRLIDRLVEIDNLYGDGSFAKDWDIYSMKKSSEKIAGSLHSGGAFRSVRKSGRTGQKMILKGFFGKMLYCGDFTPYAEVLKYLPYINLGRFNVFGCGWCNIKFVS